MDAHEQNCWDYKKCVGETRNRCPAYEYKMGRDCWVIAISYNDVGCPETKEEGLEYCVNKCLWYKQLNPVAG